MHDVTVRQEIIDRVLARRGRHHLFEALDPARTALVVIDMQNMFCEPDAPAEVPESRSICDNINRLCAETRHMGGLVIWITSATTFANGRSDWEMFLNNFVSDEARKNRGDYMSAGGHGEQLWHAMDRHDDDLQIPKNRYSALTPGSSMLPRVLASHDIKNVLIAGTKTNICCESTGRDAMMLDHQVVMVEDCCAALSDEEHRSALENMIQQFGDVMTADEVIAVLKNRPND
jgi:ureidoacrylate peracid hydrolase